MIYQKFRLNNLLINNNLLVICYILQRFGLERGWFFHPYRGVEHGAPSVGVQEL